MLQLCRAVLLRCTTTAWLEQHHPLLSLLHRPTACPTPATCLPSCARTALGRSMRCSMWRTPPTWRCARLPALPAAGTAWTGSVGCWTGRLRGLRSSPCPLALTTIRHLPTLLPNPPAGAGRLCQGGCRVPAGHQCAGSAGGAPAGQVRRVPAAHGEGRQGGCEGVGLAVPLGS